MTEKEFIKIHEEAYNILKEYPEWNADYNKEDGYILIDYDNSKFIVTFKVEDDNLSPDLIVGSLYFYDENFDQSLDQINTFNETFDSVKVFLTEGSQILFVTSICIDFISPEKYIQYTMWAIAKITYALNNAISNNMIDCFNS